MKNQTFEDYLREQHAEQYVGTDDMMPDDFSNWLQDLFVGDWIRFEKVYHTQQKKKWGEELLSKEKIEIILNKPAWRHLTPGDFYGCDVCGAMGNCNCKIKDMSSEKVAKEIATILSKRLGENR